MQLGVRLAICVLGVFGFKRRERRRREKTSDGGEHEV
jgi:hypothetical protein